SGSTRSTDPRARFARRAEGQLARPPLTGASGGYAPDLRTTAVRRTLRHQQPGVANEYCARTVHLRILVTLPAPTVRPPSRMANLSPSSMAIGLMSSTFMTVLSPGM